MRGPRLLAVQAILALTALLGVGLLFEAPAAARGLELHSVARADSHEASFTSYTATHRDQLDEQGADVDDDDAPDVACFDHVSHALRTELTSALAERRDNDSIRTVWLAIAARAPPSA